MAWEKNSPRRAQLPSDWSSNIQPAILERDGHRCQWPLTFGGVCGNPAHEVDHRYSPHDHRPSALWSLCPTHHARKTAGEAQQGRERNGRASRKRRSEQHPNRRSDRGGG